MALAKRWLTGEDTMSEKKGHLVIETLMAEIHRIQELNAKLTKECHRLQLEGAKDITLAVAEECAAICETADYSVRSYGCAHEIRMKFGLPMKVRHTA
jgi:hypothetical protein